MSGEIINISVESVQPSAEALMWSQNIPVDHTGQSRTAELIDTAISLFCDLATPRGMVSEISVAEFHKLYQGQGENAPDSVVEDILTRTTNVSLFVATVGMVLTEQIGRLFSKGEFPLASMLDSAASEGADMAADRLESLVIDNWRSQNVLSDGEAVLRFSPGYCGWHIGGQRALFEYTKPKQIGVSLSESCLMYPLKSVSGAILSAPISAFDINDNYAFCNECRNRSCRDRYRKLIAQSQE